MRHLRGGLEKKKKQVVRQVTWQHITWIILKKVKYLFHNKQ